jgi:hypothetical protein
MSPASERKHSFECRLAHQQQQQRAPINVCGTFFARPGT